MCAIFILGEVITPSDYEGITDYKELTKDDIFGLQKDDIWELLKHIGITCNNVFFIRIGMSFIKEIPLRFILMEHRTLIVY